MKPMGISINRLSRDLDVAPTRIHGIIHGARALTADTAVRLGLYFGVSPQTWLQLQAESDLRMVTRLHGAAIEKRVRRRDAA